MATYGVLTSIQLPWSTCNEDLIDLFSTIGKVERAEIQYEPNGRSRGTGVVQFDTADTAETAIGTFHFYPAANIHILIFFSLQPSSLAISTVVVLWASPS